MKSAVRVLCSLLVTVALATLAAVTVQAPRKDSSPHPAQAETVREASRTSMNAAPRPAPREVMETLALMDTRGRRVSAD